MNWSAAEYFTIVRHVLPASHPRSNPRATRTPTGPRLSIVAKEYLPKYEDDDGYSSLPTLSIAFQHGSGFTKELYEPLFVELLSALKARGVRVHSIIISDVFNQGESFVENEDRIGDHASWLDMARDVALMLQLVSPPVPVLGIGHSMGGAILFQVAAAILPNQFIALVGMDPMIEHPDDQILVTQPIAQALAVRKDLWPSRAEAERYFRDRSIYKRWDKRVYSRWIDSALRDLPTQVYPSYPSSLPPPPPGAKPVTLTTPVVQEVYSIASPNPMRNQSKHVYPVTCLESGDIYKNIRNITVPVMFVYAQNWNVISRGWRKEKLLPDAQIVVIERASHFFPFEKPVETAAVLAKFCAEQLQIWAKANSQMNPNRHLTEFGDLYKKALGIPTKKRVPASSSSSRPAASSSLPVKTAANTSTVKAKL
ncbi:Alpha/beta hydrolase family-domain-containing protein [Lipomyces oligophaga]|uniref:Alpha/beta hydrolase family-domain-containing protein n=1 Tax=Lipomyces oligophaga TaxID=45792 RepID=UPI0034CE4D9E